MDKARSHNPLPERKPEFELTDKQFGFLSNLAYERTGIVLPPNKRDMVYGRLVRRLRALRLTGFTDYCDLLAGDGYEEEIGHLINAITTNLTGFFREAHHFEHLHAVLTARAKKAPGRLRLWSAACSSGMEPYSMAMVLRSAIPNLKGWDAKILATDIDTAMLTRGKDATYLETDVEMVPPSYRRYILERDDEMVQMDAKLREMVHFRQLNLLEDWPMKGPFDAIFCRNVVIYFDKPTKIKLFDRLADMLTPKGLLYIGHSENLHGITERFNPIGRTVYERVK